MSSPLTIGWCREDALDCAVEVDGSDVNVIIGARVGECTAWFWSGRSLSNYKHGQTPRLLVGCASRLRTARLCWRTASSNCSTASWHCDFQFERSCESVMRVDGWLSTEYLLWDAIVWHAHNMTGSSNHKTDFREDTHIQTLLKTIPPSNHKQNRLCK